MLQEEIHGSSVIPGETRKHYVYLYRDERGRVRYVGRGTSSNRASSHLSGSHNQCLNDFLATRRYSLEIAGPLENVDVGLALETALISALKPDCNENKGPARYRFRPLGVPEQFAERLKLSELGREGLLASTDSYPLLLVHINATDFDDGRVGYDPSTPPNDSQILERIDRWWQLGALVNEWSNDPSKSPGTLVGVHGQPGSQIVIGSVSIDRNGWQQASRNRARYQVPTRSSPDLDAFSLRGRRISAGANIKFGPNRDQVFLILDHTGTVIGGRPSSRG